MVVNFSLSIHGGRSIIPMLEIKATAENGGERSFAEVLLSLDKVPPLTSLAKKVEPPLASKCDSEFPEMPTSKEQLMLMGPMDSDIAFIRGEDVGVEESSRNVRAWRKFQSQLC